MLRDDKYMTRDYSAGLTNIPRVEGNPHVIPAKPKGKRMRNQNDP